MYGSVNFIVTAYQILGIRILFPNNGALLRLRLTFALILWILFLMKCVGSPSGGVLWDLRINGAPAAARQTPANQLTCSTCSIMNAALCHFHATSLLSILQALRASTSIIILHTASYDATRKFLPSLRTVKYSFMIQHYKG